MILLTPLVNGLKLNQMPGRLIPLVTQQIYHIINRGVASQPVFLRQRDYIRSLETIFYYQNLQPSLRYSFFQRLSSKEREETLLDFSNKRKYIVDIIAYCFMPNHIHLILKQLTNGGISKFMSNYTNSYTRYFNTKKKRSGSLFEGKFKAVRIETDEQLLHVVRYIHLNPYTSYVIKTLDKLANYPYSSLSEYINPGKSNFCNKDLVLSHFSSSKSFWRFVFDQAEYQRELAKIKHLILEI